MTEFLLPHHDGSDLYLSNTAPKIGDQIEIRVRTPESYSVAKIYLRIFMDGEPRLFPMSVKKSSPTQKWWSSKVQVTNSVQRYRFLIFRGKKQEWLTAAGISDHDVTSTSDFFLLAQPEYPKWIHSSVFYQIFPDRFASSGKARKIPSHYVPRNWNDLPKGRDATTGIEYFGGDLDGVQQHLDHVVGLGANGIYFTPFFPARSTHRYDASSFDFVDPILGGNDALFSLAAAASKKGIRLLGDLTTNHCGAGHPWLAKGLLNRDSKEGSYFYWHDRSSHGYEGWWGLASLPKLNYSSPQLRKAMYEGTNSIVRKWLRPPFSMAGWRIDVGNMTGKYLDQDINQEVMRGIRTAMDEVNPDAWLVAENADNFPTDLDGLGWHGTMNYNGFGRVLWGWFAHKPDTKSEYYGFPEGLPQFTGAQTVAAIQQFNAMIPWRALTASMVLIDSHDTPRFRNIVGKDPVRHLAAMGMLLTYPGVPSIFAGDEIGLEGAWGEDARRTINWEDKSGWDLDFFTEVKKLVKIRRISHALAQGGLRWVDVSNDSISYLRESKKETLLVFVSRKAVRRKIDLTSWGYAIDKTLYGPESIGSVIDIDSKSAVIGIWKLR
ncbi:MAG: glycoside hydrolase family 13 protein [Actinomycetes bacterium]